MTDPARVKLLHGPYRSPRCRLGRKLLCELKGWVPVTRMSAGRIPWPMTTATRGRSFILCGDLVKAVKRESAAAVCHWWGVTGQTVSKWCKALGVDQYNEGTRKLHEIDGHERPLLDPDVAMAAASRATPEARKKIAASRRGQPIHPNTLAALKRRKGRKTPDDVRRKIGESLRRAGVRPPKAGQPWTPAEEALLGTMPDREAAARTGRTVSAVTTWRNWLRIPSFLGKGPKMKDPRPRSGGAP